MKFEILGRVKQPIPDQEVKGLGYISKNGENFLPSIVRLTEILSGRHP